MLYTTCPSTDKRFTMKYTRQEWVDIGRRIYAGELNFFEAGKEYGIVYSAARYYMRFYRETNGLPPKRIKKRSRSRSTGSPGLE